MMFMQPVNPHGLSPSFGQTDNVCPAKLATATAGYAATLLDATARALQQMIVGAQRQGHAAVAHTIQARLDTVRGLSLLASANAPLMASDVLSDAQLAEACAAVAQVLHEGAEWGADTRELTNVLTPEKRKRAIGGILLASGVTVFTAAALIGYFTWRQRR